MQKYHVMFEAANAVLRAYTVDSDLGFKPSLPFTSHWNLGSKMKIIISTGGLRCELNKIRSTHTEARARERTLHRICNTDLSKC